MTAASTFTIPSIPSTYSHLRIYTYVKTSRSAQIDPMYLQFNGDTATNYSRTILYGTGSVTFSGRTTNFANIPIDGIATLDTSNFNYNSVTSIQNYANSTTYKTTLTRTNNAATGTDANIGLWRSTAAITSVTIFTSDSGNYASGSTFTLYGIKAA